MSAQAPKQHPILRNASNSCREALTFAEHSVRKVVQERNDRFFIPYPRGGFRPPGFGKEEGRRLSLPRIEGLKA
ncbi:hypothetical protein AFK68_04245 [Hydrocoleum sp. CS-953]|uniref:hypothetical protein n=1 Tax=Hydrocoleum sp. CS-953 TaxID=1671698 RepID=UPI000B9B7C14|nr:hypothetical protein [Hydrocoleum sp. CS-953]OZH55494.1 hypothetical protein AFK68_04245 [Hydrocoleum sp. CS-953]